MCEGVTTAEFLEGVTRSSSLPSLTLPGPARSVPPVPSQCRKSSTAQEQECVNNLQNCESHTVAAASGLSSNLEMGDGVMSKSCQDILCADTAVDPHVYVNNNEIDASLKKDSFSTACALATDVAVLNDRNVKHTVCGPALPVKPPRFKRLPPKQLPETSSSSGVDEITRTTVTCVPKVETVTDSEGSAVQQSERPIPQPKPRTSVQRRSLVLQSDKTDMEQSCNELAVEGDAETADSRCTCAESDVDTPKTLPTHNASGITQEEVKDRQSCVHQKLCDDADDSVGSVELEQNQLEVKNNVSVLVPSRAAPHPVLVPSRAAPPPPLPKPKIVIHSSGSVEFMKPSVDGDGTENATLSDNDSVPDSYHSSSMSESGSEKLSNRYLQQPVENSEISLSDSALSGSPGLNGSLFCHSSSSGMPTAAVTAPNEPIAVNSVTKVESENCKLSGANEGCKVKPPVPAVRKTKKSQHSCPKNSEILSYSHSFSSQSDMNNVHPCVIATRRWSEGVCRFNNPDLTTSDADGSVSSECTQLNSPQSPANWEMYLDTPPITPAAFGFDAHDEEARTVCSFLLLNQLIQKLALYEII